jgi:hypothetical protein
MTVKYGRPLSTSVVTPRRLDAERVPTTFMPFPWAKEDITINRVNRSSSDLKSLEVNCGHIERSPISTRRKFDSEIVPTSFISFPVGEKEKNLRCHSNQSVSEPKVTIVR